MIVLNTGSLDELNMDSLSEVERNIVRWKIASRVRYDYSSLDALRFELRMRKNTVDACYAMFHSGAQFAVFSRSRCNPRFWIRTRNGGFLLRKDVRPSDAIRDIYNNGQLYAFECSGAIIILYYRAVLETIGDATFNYYFQDLFLRDWQKDYDLRLVASYDLNDAYPGDCCYFRNPDHHPRHPEWQGENAIMLDRDLFFGHGVGVQTSAGIIANLNRARRPFARRSAYMENLIVRPDFEMLRALIIHEQRIGIESGELVLEDQETELLSMLA
ncbi:protein-glutamine gamma-glutamyltransferase [Paenibacillus montaniterrae]|uniref:Protein-glutamine gamma-glutamyltransferase n=1 Tax=Paenibacillus montaniterrae TaxID=429341 RepID=A0A919YWC3_9BACL|nr:protein-glutamine gamma-glutamyltransferase [Paenibacillus montaniterrae]GIP17988.1 protein-glutamine gamma-glutamyltransferase [Paenibacillus montaniterrae]